jgi:molybdopterin converting factor small subunit
MKINVEFLGFPMVSDVIGKKKLELNIFGETVKDVIDELIKCYGNKVRDAFYDPYGNFDQLIQIAINNKSFISTDQHEIPLLEEGYKVAFMLLLAGG